MHNTTKIISIIFLSTGLVACRKGKDDKKAAPAAQASLQPVVVGTWQMTALRSASKNSFMEGAKITDGNRVEMQITNDQITVYDFDGTVVMKQISKYKIDGKKLIATESGSKNPFGFKILSVDANSMWVEMTNKPDANDDTQVQYQRIDESKLKIKSVQKMELKSDLSAVSDSGILFKDTYTTYFNSDVDTEELNHCIYSQDERELIFTFGTIQKIEGKTVWTGDSKSFFVSTSLGAALQNDVNSTNVTVNLLRGKSKEGVEIITATKPNCDVLLSKQGRVHNYIMTCKGLKIQKGERVFENSQLKLQGQCYSY